MKNNKTYLIVLVENNNQKILEELQKENLTFISKSQISEIESLLSNGKNLLINNEYITDKKLIELKNKGYRYYKVSCNKNPANTKIDYKFNINEDLSKQIKELFYMIEEDSKFKEVLNVLKKI